MQTLPLKILPVRLGLENQMSSEDKFVPKLTKDGIHHPITQLMASPEESQKIWNSLPQMDGYNRNLGLQAESAALLVHPSEKNRRSKMPILAIREVGKGRVICHQVSMLLEMVLLVKVSKERAIRLICVLEKMPCVGL